MESSNRAILTFDALLYRNCFVCQTIIRERKNIRYHYASIIYHLVILLFATWLKLPLFVPFLIFLIRAIWLPKLGLKAKQVGMAEIGFSMMLYVFVLFLYF